MTTAPRDNAPVRTLLVDDEPLALDNLRVGLRRHPDVEIVGEAGDGRQAVQQIRGLDPDLVFLDVQMPDMDGFGVLRELAESETPEVVFVTAFDQHALQAFDVHALDYLLKPFDDARFDDCVARTVTRVRDRGRGQIDGALQALLRQIAPDTAATPHSEYIERITVRSSASIYYVAIDELDWLEATGNYVRLHTGTRQHLIRSTLNDLMDRLDPRRFVRIHRSAAVNVVRIRELQPWSSGNYIAILHDGRRLKVSRNYKDGLLRPFA